MALGCGLGWPQDIDAAATAALDFEGALKGSRSGFEQQCPAGTAPHILHYIQTTNHATWPCCAAAAGWRSSCSAATRGSGRQTEPRASGALPGAPAPATSAAGRCAGGDQLQAGHHATITTTDSVAPPNRHCAVMVAVPEATPVTTPDAETVATAALDVVYR